MTIRNLTIFLTLIWLVVLAFLITIIASFDDMLFFIFSGCIFALPGILLGWIFSKASRQNPEWAILGSVIGLVVSSFTALLISYFVQWNVYYIIIGIALLSVSIYAIGARHRLRIQKIDPGTTWHYADYAILLAFLLIVSSSFILPYKNLGIPSDGKYIYTWLFGHDFINRMVTSVSISQGVPPENPHFAGEALRYYYVSYVLPAFVYSLSERSIPMQSIMQMTCVTYTLLMVCTFFCFVRSLFKERATLIIIMVFSFVAYSYVDLYVLLKFLCKNYFENIGFTVGDYNLLSFSSHSHTFYRFFLVQPQAVMGISVFLVTFALFRINRRYNDSRLFILIGILIGLEFGVEAVTGLVLAFWYGIVQLYSFSTEQKKEISLLKSLFLPAFAALIIYLMFFIVQMYSFQSGASALIFQASPARFVIAPIHFILDYGPSWIFGLLGVIVYLKKRDKNDVTMNEFLILFGLALLLILFIANPVERDFGLLKGARILPICLLTFSGYFFQNAGFEKKCGFLCIALSAIAIPSYFTDIHTSSDVKNKSQMTYVNASDYKACQWIKENIPVKATVQSIANYPEYNNDAGRGYSYSLVSVFGERRVAVGEWKISHSMHDSTEKATTRHNDIKRMFESENVAEAIKVLRKYRIDYIYIGSYEKKLYPSGALKFASLKEGFERVYSAEGVEIYRVK